jgi:alpha-tubulin suppressor-like RCC1 family protein
MLENGIVYVWGSNEWGQCANGSSLNYHKPVPVSALKGVKIISIACGDGHCVALSDKGVVYTWGWNHWNQLGHGECAPNGLRYPTPVLSLSNKFVTKIGAVTCFFFVKYFVTISKLG